jgi:hypothetical protein
MMAYGDKRDYPKIEIFVDGLYRATTSWAKTCREAVEHYRTNHPEDADKKVLAFFHPGKF